MVQLTNESIPVVLVPGLFCTARLYAQQIPALWKFGPVMVADHTRDESMHAMAKRILSHAPPQFALAGLSMGGYIAFEIMVQAPERIMKLALLDTSARPDGPEQRELRLQQIDIARAGKLSRVVDASLPNAIHRDEGARQLLREMAFEAGPEVFIRQTTAIMNRADSRPRLAAIRCPTLVLVGAEDRLIPPDRSEEIAAGIAGSRLEKIDDAGHMPTIEQPEATTRALVEWLQGSR